MTTTLTWTLVGRQVDAGVPLQVALSQHDTWLQERGVAAHDFAVVTWSDWDLKVMLESECKWRHIQKPLYFNRCGNRPDELSRLKTDTLLIRRWDVEMETEVTKEGSGLPGGGGRSGLLGAL